MKSYFSTGIPNNNSDSGTSKAAEILIRLRKVRLESPLSILARFDRSKSHLFAKSLALMPFSKRILLILLPSISRFLFRTSQSSRFLKKHLLSYTTHVKFEYTMKPNFYPLLTIFFRFQSKSKIQRAIQYSLFYCILLSTACAQVNQAWNTSYQTKNDTFEILVFKADQHGNTYAGGYEGKNMFLQKINSQGIIEWTINNNKMIDSIPNGAFWNTPLDCAKVADLVFDSAGQVYAVVSKSYNGSEWFGCVLQLSPEADSLLFFHVYSPSLSYWGANIVLVLPKIALIQDKNQILVYTAMWDPVNNHHHLLFQFDPQGLLIRYKILNGQANGNTGRFMNDILARDNFIYTYGTILHSSGNGNYTYKTVLTKLDTSLNAIWYRYEGPIYPYGLSGNNAAHKLHIDNDQIFTISTLYDTSYAPFNPASIFCHHYDSNGDVKNIFHYNRNINTTDRVNDILVAEQNIYVSGTSYDTSNGTSKGILMVLNMGLDTLWTREFGNKITGKVLIERTSCQDQLFLSYADSTALGNELHLVKFNSSGDILFDTITLVSSDPGYNGLTWSKTGLTLTYNPVLPVDTVNYLSWYDQEQIKEPISFTAPLVTARSIHLSWILGAGNADSLIIYRKTGQSNWSPLVVVSSSLTAYLDTFLTPNESYTYSLRVRSGQNYSCDSLFLTSKTLLNTGIPDARSSDSQVILYPNPTSGAVVIKMQEGQPLELVEVFDTRGRLVLEETGQTIHLDAMPPGVYLVRINKLSHHKIIKQ